MYSKYYTYFIFILITIILITFIYCFKKKNMETFLSSDKSDYQLACEYAQGPDKNYEKSLKLLKKSAEKGSNEAKEMIKKIERIQNQRNIELNL